MEFPAHRSCCLPDVVELSCLRSAPEPHDCWFPPCGPEPENIYLIYNRGYTKGFQKYSKTCQKRPLKSRQKKVLMANGSLMKVKSIAECSP